MRTHHVIVAAGAVAGVVLGNVIWHTDPAFLGWVFGLGVGLLGGAFAAAITSGTALAGGRTKRTRREREWLLRGDDDDR